MGTITYRKDRKKYVAKLEGRGAEKRVSISVTIPATMLVQKPASCG